MKQTDFPIVTLGEFHTQHGKFYAHRGNGAWVRLECYLPCAEGTYGEPIAATAERLLARMNDGVLEPKLADSTEFSMQPGGILRTTKVPDFWRR